VAFVSLFIWKFCITYVAMYPHVIAILPKTVDVRGAHIIGMKKNIRMGKPERKTRECVVTTLYANNLVNTSSCSCHGNVDVGRHDSFFFMVDA
jgi:hypothetical protein